jgi:hypothetical protein
MLFSATATNAAKRPFRFPNLRLIYLNFVPVSHFHPVLTRFLSTIAYTSTYTRPRLTFPNKLASRLAMSIFNHTRPIVSAHVPIQDLSGDNTHETHRRPIYKSAILAGESTTVPS